jgi:hypothetical protein
MKRLIVPFLLSFVIFNLFAATISSVNDSGLESIRKSAFIPDDSSATEYALRVSLTGTDGSAIGTHPVSDIENSLLVTNVEKTYPAFLSYFRKVVVATGYTTIASAISKDDTVITVADGTKMTVGHQIAIWTATGVDFYTARILAVAGNNVTVDTPLSADFPVGASASSGSTDMAVDGSTTAQIFKVRQPDMPVLAGGVEIVINRIIIQCYTSGAVDSLAKFGDLTALTKGIFLRYQNGTASNIFNVKTNGEIRALAYDFDEFTALGNNQDGFTSRLTFGSNGKVGTSFLLRDGDALELWVQDDLTGLTKFEIMAEGYIRPVGQ